MTPSEGTVLWNAPEKLYGSWQFRVLGTWIFAAMMLAGAGTLLIGGQAVELRKNLEDSGKKELERIDNTWKKEFERIKEQADEIMMKIHHVEEGVEKLEKSKDSIITNIVNAMTSDLAPLKNNFMARVNALDFDVNNGKRQLDAIQPNLTLVVETVKAAGDVPIKVNEILAHHGTALKASQNAEAARDAAQAAATQADGIRKTLSENIGPLWSKLLVDWYHLGAIQIQAQLESISERLAAMEKRIANPEPRAGNNPNGTGNGLVPPDPTKTN